MKLSPSSVQRQNKHSLPTPFVNHQPFPPPLAWLNLLMHPMSRQRETNPHFYPPQPPLEPRPQPRHGSTYHFPVEPQPQAPLQNKIQTPETYHGSHSPIHTQETPLQPIAYPTTEHSHPNYRHQPSHLRVPTVRKTKPFAWILAAFCALFWIIIIVGGLIVLIIYLIFRPHSPKFDITGASLNAAYLDMGYLLNGDVTLLANFTNANKKVNVDFTYVVMDLYFQETFIATTYVRPLTVVSGRSRLEIAHITPSQVRLSLAHSQQFQRQIDNGRVKLQVRGLIRARSKLGGIFRYSYWLYSRCDILITGPPNGVMTAHRCVTKR